ncbi:hypothetical protein Bacsa_3668 (plasmid) [Phocaeicola salanitronis DSM 18170]|uniref:DUF4099 domain-containing protein n=1 Tax=Phocaeicola salanitronis (strain DSM 18170 / JCM 13657 / CCUG 60908 / BL78) TaxID=667015 RepID=F0R968_PHOSB|nr:DUF4099 domain-containing protein [Phocaeicola salanitronis]ADY38189.1 hypothetical protein Bacsa_3668 [Phocaeicola salanitronis DSM 18170]
MNNRQEYFKENDIPYGQLEKVGLTKMDILSLPKTDLESLLSGKRTSLLNLKGIDMQGHDFEIKAKISLYRKEDHSVGVKIHPVRNCIQNDANLKPQELNKLQSGSLITKKIDGEKYLLQLDKETNEILKAKLRSIIIPSFINGSEISSKQKEELKNGETIVINNGNDKIKVRIDLNSQKGIQLYAFEQQQKRAYDFHNPKVSDVIHTDRNRAEYLEYQQKQISKQKEDTVKLKF